MNSILRASKVRKKLSPFARFSCETRTVDENLTNSAVFFCLFMLRYTVGGTGGNLNRGNLFMHDLDFRREQRMVPKYRLDLLVG